jgi:hypothetical protein
LVILLIWGWVSWIWGWVSLIFNDNLKFIEIDIENRSGFCFFFGKLGFSLFS